MNALEIARSLQLSAKPQQAAPPPRRRVAVYARYSSVKQNDLSIDGQLREATEYCLKHDYAIVAQYVDQAKSGRSRGARAEFNRMMEDSARGIFDIVLVYKFNRFFRNLNQQSICLEELKKTMDPSRYVGRSKEQVEEFLREAVQPILEENKELLGVKAEINV